MEIAFDPIHFLLPVETPFLFLLLVGPISLLSQLFTAKQCHVFPRLSTHHMTFKKSLPYISLCGVKVDLQNVREFPSPLSSLKYGCLGYLNQCLFTLGAFCFHVNSDINS
ncbi:hypothetical protein GDO86_017475 [Hymenochirus boettgeri]|uniref:Uncharacterized protein n=1 Tax=Hymenochirus boettgeri TaxID=247094 RepID=A0A8T2IRV2_9PIPI|nr:hypothetical protein GDO86_017475 [Hymenochirus boettgeri]